MRNYKPKLKRIFNLKLKCYLLRSVPWRLDAAADDGAAGGVDAEGGAHHRERDGEADAQRGPHVRRRLGEEPAEVDALATTRQLQGVWSFVI